MFYIPLDTYSAVSEMSISRLSLALMLTSNSVQTQYTKNHTKKTQELAFHREEKQTKN